jgi:hypothetical protein
MRSSICKPAIVVTFDACVCRAVVFDDGPLCAKLSYGGWGVSTRR